MRQGRATRLSELQYQCQTVSTGDHQDARSVGDDLESFLQVKASREACVDKFLFCPNGKPAIFPRYLRSKNTVTVKKSNVLLFLFLIAAGVTLSAQNVETGVKAYEVGDYKAAMAELDKVLTDPSKLKEKVLARAYFYRGMARMTYISKAKGNLETTEMQQVRALTLGAHADMIAAKKNDIDGKMAADIAAGNKRLLDLLIELGKSANDIAQDPNKKPAEKQDAYADLVRYGEPINALDKFHYLGYMFLANGQIGQGDSVSALKNYHFTDDWFFKTAPKDGDLFIAYTYIQIARLEWALNKNYEVANKALEEGRKVLDAEHRKIETLGGHTPTQKAALSRKYHDVGLDLDRAGSDLRLAAGK